METKIEHIDHTPVHEPKPMHVEHVAPVEVHVEHAADVAGHATPHVDPPVEVHAEVLAEQVGFVPEMRRKRHAKGSGADSVEAVIPAGAETTEEPMHMADEAADRGADHVAEHIARTMREASHGGTPDAPQPDSPVEWTKAPPVEHAHDKKKKK